MDWNFVCEDWENISPHACERSFLTARFKCEKPLFCWNEFTEDAEVLE